MLVSVCGVKMDLSLPRLKFECDDEDDFDDFYLDDPDE